MPKRIYGKKDFSNCDEPKRRRGGQEDRQELTEVPQSSAEEDLMKAFKVWNNKRTIKKFVVGINCYEDLVTKGGEKLGVSAVKAVLEEDGTEIDNEYLEFLDPNNAIILLEQQQNWTDKDNCNLPVSEGHGQLHETKKTPPVVPSGAKKQATITREMRLGPPIEEVKEEPVEEEVMKDAMIYGKNLAKPLSEYQIAVNKAAGKLALQSPVLLSNRGELYEKAREQVKVDGYSFKKGFSRSNSGTSSCSSSETETVSPKVKRAKRDKDERKRCRVFLAGMMLPCISWSFK